MTAPYDDGLMAELAALIYAQTEPPPEVLDVAKELFVWRSVDAELASLTYDSLTHDSLLDRAPAGSRAGAQPRQLAFESDGFSIDAEVDSAPGSRTLIGQIVPAGPADIELQSDAASARTRADELGRFVLPLPLHEIRIRLRCVTADRIVETAWVLI